MLMRILPPSRIILFGRGVTPITLSEASYLQEESFYLLSYHKYRLSRQIKNLLLVLLRNCMTRLWNSLSRTFGFLGTRNYRPLKIRSILLLKFLVPRNPNVRDKEFHNLVMQLRNKTKSKFLI